MTKITSKLIIEKLKEALHRFGTYSFDDKGSYEVMDIDSITDQLKLLSADKTGQILKEVANSKGVFKIKNRSKRLAEDLLGNCETMPEEWFEKVMEISGLEY